MTYPLPFLLPMRVGLIALAMPVFAQVPNTLLHSIPAPPTGVQSGAQLGHSVAVDGGYTAVGAIYDDLGAQDSGVVKIFDTETGALLHIIANPNPGEGRFFGQSVAISGSRMVTGTAERRTAYVFDLSSDTPTIPVVILQSPNPSGGDYFGISVAVSGTRVVVGAMHDDTGANSAGSAYVYDLSSATPAMPVATLNNPSPSASDFFGYAVAVSGTRVVVGTQNDDTGASDSGSAYVYDLSSATPTVPVVTINNPTPAAGDEFGGAVAISCMRVVIGAWADDTGTINAGSAYVYDLSSGTPAVPIVTLINPTPQTSDWFGKSVAISGTRVVAGAYGDSSGLPFTAGSAYVYDLTGATPTVPVATLHGPSEYDYFGWSVAVSATKVVVGAPSDDTGAPDVGSAYVYDLSGATPTAPVATLITLTPVPNDQFGTSVAISGTMMVVGAPQDDTGAENTGMAYVYDLASATPTVPVATLNNPGLGNYAYFGHSVAISGTRVVVGAYQTDTIVQVGLFGVITLYAVGSAYIYDLSSATPTVPVATLKNPSPEQYDLFGYSVAISGTRVVVGAFADDTGASAAGSAYVYDLSSATPTVPVQTLNNPSPEADDYFGSSVAISGTRVVVGAYGDDTGASAAGTAYVYDLSSATPTLPAAALNKPSPAASDNFGYSVAISGMQVVVGAYRDDTGATDAGSAYVYDLSSATPAVSVAFLNNPAPAAGDWFGTTVAISGTRVVVGASNDATVASSVGSGYVYDLTSATPTVPVATLNNPGPAMGDGFGSSVAIDGITVAIGTPFDDSPQADKGSAYVFGPHPLDQDSDGLRDAWELSYWPSATGHSPLDDDDHDGLVNLLELGFGLNPTLPNGAALPPTTTEGNYLTLTLTKQPGVTYEVQSAGSLLPALPDSFSPSSTTVLINDATTLKVRDNFLIGSSPPRFMRVKVMAAP